MENEEKVMDNVKENDDIVYQLSQDEYQTLVEGLKTYKEKYEEAVKMLQEEKENVVELLLRIEALEDQLKHMA